MIPDLIVSRFQGYQYDCDAYCEECLPVDEDAEGVGVMQSWDEHDSPPHCSHCRRPLRGNLTGEGIATVIDWAKECLQGDADDREDLIDLANLGEAKRQADYYRGSRAPAIARDWAAWLVQNHCVTGRDKRFLELFLHYTRPRSRLELALLRLPEALRDYVDERGVFDKYSDVGSYPLVYTNGDSEWYHPDCAKELWLNATGRDRPIKGAQVLWETDGDPWPDCEECGGNLEVAYPPDGFTAWGEKEAKLC